MAALLILLISVGLILMVATYLNRRKAVEETEIRTTPNPNQECCGAHEVCDRNSLLSAENKVLYYDDEELDELAGIPADKFSTRQKEQLFEIFSTLKESDVAGWLCSLQLRRINLPTDLREEALLVVSKRRP
ncbi:MAG TPA: hypothetical protein VK152_02200 [Paludibacter sp.]|nr:hypothetical protein [Paludibacter sp.]